jgi:polyhydroxyalkanoate synthesis repressor PhaR
VNDTAERPQRVIRRYANRKLYDATESRYVTLQDVEALVHRGFEVCVVDNRTGEDVTQTALAQILCDAGRRKDPRYSLSNILAIFHRPDLEGRVRDFLRRRSEDKPKAPPAPEPPAAAGTSKGGAEESERSARDVLSSLGRGLEEFQRKVDERIRQIVNDLEPLRRLNSEVRSLSERLSALERTLGQGRPGAPKAGKKRRARPE